MAKNIIISGDTLSGKTMVALALAAKIREKGKTVSYFKPVGDRSFTHSTPEEDVDVDALVMKQVLDMKASTNCICPLLRMRSRYDEFLQMGHKAMLEKIMTCYEEVAEGMDYVIIEGAKAPWYYMHVQLSTPELAKLLDAFVIGLVNFPDITAIDDILLQKQLFAIHGINSIDIALSIVPPMLKKTVNEGIKLFIEENGLHFCGVIYQRHELFSPSIREILHAIDGQMITGEDKLELLIEKFMVGGMSPENALKWFRRAKDKAVITSGDRADMCLAAMETDTNLLILVGGVGPDIRTVSRAKELGIPIMMTRHDTYTTGQIVNNLIGNVVPEDTEKIKTIERIIGEALEFRAINE